jgi:hypothetical protein
MSVEVVELFPTPVMRVPAILSSEAAGALAQRLAQSARVANDRSEQLSHTRILGPGDDAGLDAVVEKIGPHLQAFGQLLFGESLRWIVKEIWVNVLQSGGRQHGCNREPLKHVHQRLMLQVTQLGHRSVDGGIRPLHSSGVMAGGRRC